jgi:hypothetical protein
MPRTSAAYRATLRRLRDSLGAQFLVQLPQYEPLTKVQRVTQRVDARRAYRGLFSVPPMDPCDVVFVIDWAYGPESNVWRTRPAKMLRQAIARADFDRTRCGFVSLSPDPPPEFGDGGAPVVDHGGLLDLLDACDTRYVVFVGAHPQRVWHPEVSLGAVAGRVGIWRNWYVIAIQHPNAVLRELVDMRDWLRYLSEFRDRIDSESRWILGMSCANNQCVEPATIYDARGIGWCDKHLDPARRLLERRPPRDDRDQLTLGTEP